MRGSWRDKEKELRALVANLCTLRPQAQHEISQAQQRLEKVQEKVLKAQEETRVARENLRLAQEQLERIKLEHP